MYIFRFIKPYKGHVFSIMSLLLIYNLLSVLLPYLTFTVIIDKLLPTNDYKMINIVAAGVFLLVIVMALVELFQGYLMSYLGSKVTFDIRQHLLRHLQKLSLKFYSDRNSGEILTRLNTDVAGIQQILTNQLITLVTSSIKFVFLTFVVFYMNWKLATPLFILVLIQMVVFIISFKKLHGGIHELSEKKSKLVGNIQERISLVKVIQVFVRQKYEDRLHYGKSMKIIKKAMEIANTRAQMIAVIEFVIDFSPITVLWFGAYFIVEGEIEIGAVIAMWAYANEYINPIHRIIGVLNSFQESLVGVQRVKAYLDEEPEVKEVKNPIKDHIIKGAIEFNNVNFAYEENKQVLFDVSLKIKGGETVAFVGESGSGKSTISNLIFRFYDPTGGEVILDGKPLKNYSLRFLRKNIGVVFQDTDLFVATLRDNLVYGATHKLSDKEIMVAARTSLLEEVINKLPDGLDTMVEEKGGNFSGGEKQRIAICRLIIRNPNILIFDEATSALDSKSEKLISQAMDKLMDGPTSIIIAHRLSTVIKADRIFVFNKGKIIEHGNHMDLLNKKGEYKRLWDEQLKTEGSN